MRKDRFLQNLRQSPNWEYWQPEEGGHVVVFWWNGNTGDTPSHQQYMDDYVINRLGWQELTAAVKRGRKNDHMWPCENYQSPREARAKTEALNLKAGVKEKGVAVDEAGVPEESGRDG